MKKIIIILMTIFSLVYNVDANEINEKKINKNIVNNINFERNNLKIEIELLKIEKNTKEFFIKELELLNNKKIILNNLILNIELSNPCIRNCELDSNNKALKALYEDKIKILNPKILENKKSIEIEIKKEKKIKIEEKIKKKKEKNNKTALNSLNKADKYFKSGNYKNAKSYYRLSCNYNKIYECHYGLGISNYLIAKSYIKDLKYYGYKDLYKKGIKEAIENLKISNTLTDDKVKINKSNNLIEEINNFKISKLYKPEKTEKTYNLGNKKKILEKKGDSIEKKDILPKKDKIHKKVEKIFNKLEKITDKYSINRKKKLYSKLVLKLSKYKNKTKKSNLKELIELLIIKLKN